MKAKYIILLSIIATMTLSSCGDATYLTSDKDAISVGIEGGSGSLNIDSDGGDIAILYAPEWANVELNGDELSYEIGANEGYAMRKGYVVIACDEQRLVLGVNQATNPTYLVIPKTRAIINKDGSGVGLVVMTDGGDIKVECPENISHSYYNGVLTFSSEGHSGRAKSYKATVICGEFKKNISILQKGDICATCGGRGRITCSYCGGDGILFFPYRECNRCWGKGTVRCPTCGGRGK